MTSPWVSRDCALPGCPLEAEPYRELCGEHLRERQAIETLVVTYAPTVRRAAAAMEIPDAGPDECESVAMEALWEAARRWRVGRKVPFPRFLALVVRLRLHDAGAKARRRKNQIVAQSVREVWREWGMVDVLETLPALVPSPLRVAIARESLSNVIHDMNFVLTTAERTAIQGLLNDLTYDEIALSLGGDRRTVDNAVQRGRRKLAAALA